MKVTVVPAQITTVEDRIAGNLGLSQILLLVAPIFLGTAIYLILPPFGKTADYKILAITSLVIACGLLAIRIKGTIVLLWLTILLRFGLRPRYYLFNKNSLAGREQYQPTHNVLEQQPAAAVQPKRSPLMPLAISDVVKLESLMQNPAANLSFIANRKGGWYVHITEVKE